MRHRPPALLLSQGEGPLTSADDITRVLVRMGFKAQPMRYATVRGDELLGVFEGAGDREGEYCLLHLNRNGIFVHRLPSLDALVERLFAFDVMVEGLARHMGTLQKAVAEDGSVVVGFYCGNGRVAGSGQPRNRAERRRRRFGQ